MNKIIELKKQVGNYKVLFVEDEKEIRETTHSFLKKIFNHIVTATNGEDGLEKFKLNKDFDVIITDVAMPELDGKEMVNQIKLLDPNIKVVYITATNQDSYDLDDIYFKKPLSFEDMIELLERLVAPI